MSESGPLPCNRRALALTALALLPVTPVSAAEDRFCEAPPSLFQPQRDPATVLDGDAPDGALQFEAGEGDIQLGGSFRLSDGVIIRRDDNYLAADEVEHNPDLELITLRGDVQYSGLGSSVTGQGAEFDYGTGRVRFAESRFALPEGRGRGEAGMLELDRGGRIRVADASYTSCPPDTDDWLIRAGDISLDTTTGIGTARNLRLDFQGVPILYAPYLSFPLTDARKSGVLLPDFGLSGRNGTEISVPYYWNIAANYDATITPRLLSKRGLELGTEFRYLTRGSEGTLDLRYLPNDNEFGDTRTFATVLHRTYLPDQWRVRIDARDVTDTDYFEDLGGSQSAASTTFLNRSIVFDRYGEHWQYFLRAQAYQVLDDELLPQDEPYRRLPQLVARGHWDDVLAGIDLSLDNELTAFDRDTGVTGARLHMSPTLSWPLERGGLFMTPEASFDYTVYRLDDTAVGQDDSPERALPTVSLDVGAIFEREAGSERQWLQTLEPRVLYVHTPYRDQNDIPVFDTIAPDFNIVQIFRKRPLLGYDRIVDLDQVSLGVTSRLIATGSGRTIVRGTIGQTRFLSTRGVTLPGEPLRTGESSDYIAEIDVLLSERWNFEAGHQWNSEASETVKSEFRLQYQPRDDSVINLAYRFRRDSLEQADVSFAWPVGERWNVVGRYNYSLRDDTTLERFVGLEYESCCWAVRVVSRRYISRRDGTADSSVAIQLELKGLTSVGDPADRQLERGILGYRGRQD